jgi:hypothetical protein
MAKAIAHKKNFLEIQKPAFRLHFYYKNIYLSGDPVLQTSARFSLVF